MDSNWAKVDCFSGFSNCVFGGGGSCEVVGFLGLVIVTRGHQNLTVLFGVNEGRFSYNNDKLSKTAIIRII